MTEDMGWFRVDDGFHSHPKVLAVGNEAAGLYVRCGSWCAQHRTDGQIPREIALLYGNTGCVSFLEAEGLWIPTKTGWRMHDYLAYNPSKKQVEAERRKAADRQKRYRERHAEDHESNAVTDGVTHASVTPSVTPSVTVPHPIPLTTTTTTKNTPPLRGAPPSAAPPGPNTRGTRIPDDFAPTPDMVEWAQALVPSIRVERANEDFCDYWATKAGQAARKVDWNRTWKRWMRKQSDDAPKARTNGHTNGHQMATSDRKFMEAQELKRRMAARGPQRPQIGAS